MNSSENNILSHVEKSAIHGIIIDCVSDKKSRLLNINDAETSLSSNSMIYLASILNKVPFITRINLLGSRFAKLSALQYSSEAILKFINTLKNRPIWIEVFFVNTPCFDAFFKQSTSLDIDIIPCNGHDFEFYGVNTNINASKASEEINDYITKYNENVEIIPAIGADSRNKRKEFFQRLSRIDNLTFSHGYDINIYKRLLLKTFYYNFSRLFGISEHNYLPMYYHDDSFESKNPFIPDEMLDRILNYVSYKDVISKTQETLIKMNHK